MKNHRRCCTYTCEPLKVFNLLVQRIEPAPVCRKFLVQRPSLYDGTCQSVCPRIESLRITYPLIISTVKRSFLEQRIESKRFCIADLRI
jgi:hypothetical protein